MSPNVVFFDIDFTLIYPGPTFNGEGYRKFATKYGLSVDPNKYKYAVSVASAELTQQQNNIYRAELFVGYAQRVLEEMGAVGHTLNACAREIYDEWSCSRHFLLYDDVIPVMRDLQKSGLILGLISNTHRSMSAFQRHFNLTSYLSVAISSYEHGYMKPEPSIFYAALEQLDVSAADAVMVGDSVPHDIKGACQVGMGAVLVNRSALDSQDIDDAIPVIRTLRDLPAELKKLGSPI